MPRRILFGFLLTSMLLLNGCFTGDIKLFRDYSDPLVEYSLQGKGDNKIVLIPVHGVVSTERHQDIMSSVPSMVEEVVSHLRLAARDKHVKAVVLQIDSPGGSVTASDMLYQEVMSFKKETGKKVIVEMMDVAASGGYYIALASDKIIAHPTTITGSIGVIFIRPNIDGLMGKIGVEAEVTKSGKLKDMGSPFRDPTPEEQQLFQDMVDEMYGRFVGLVAKHRKMDDKRARELADGRIYTSEQAMKTGLIDQVGYVDDAISQAKILAGTKKARVVVYRRTAYPNDNIYNNTTAKTPGATPSPSNLDQLSRIAIPHAGLYYIWAPALIHE